MESREGRCESQNQWPRDVCVLSSGVSRLKLTPYCMSLKTVDSGSRLKSGSVEYLELLHPSKVIGLWVLCCLFVNLLVLYVYVGRGTIYVHAPRGQFQIIIPRVLYTLLILRTGLSLAWDLPV